MKVQPNPLSIKKYTSEYFKEENFIKNIYKYEYCKNTKRLLHVVFNIDSSFCRPLGVTIVSILENSSDLDFSLHIFMDTISEKDSKRLSLIAQKYCVNIYIYIMHMDAFEGFHIKKARFKKVCYFRLYMNKLLKNITDRFLYLDADLICLRSLSPFLEVDFKGNSVAAVSDTPTGARALSQFLGLNNSAYFNSGVLLINCREWEKKHITEQAFSYQGVPANNFACHDQDILNLVLDGDVKYLDRKFNHLGNYENTPPDNCIIYHFIGREKPWELALRSIDKQWRYYLEISPFENIINELPPKTSSYYYYYKTAAYYYKNQGKITKAINCCFWYSILKIKKLYDDYFQSLKNKSLV